MPLPLLFPQFPLLVAQLPSSPLCPPYFFHNFVSFSPPFSVFLIFPSFLFVFHFLSSFFSMCFFIPIDFILFFILFFPCFFLTLVSIPLSLFYTFTHPSPLLASFPTSFPLALLILISLFLTFPFPPSPPFSSLFQSYNWGDDGP